MSKIEEPTFWIVTGSWLPPESLDPLKIELDALGYESHIAEISANISGTNFETDGKEVFDQIGDTKNVVYVGWSRGFQVALRAAVMAEKVAKRDNLGRSAVQHLVAFGGSADTSTIPLLQGEDRRGRNSPEFRALIRDVDEELSIIYDKNDPTLSLDERMRQRKRVVEILCPDCDSITQQDLIEGLRPHRRIANEPALAQRPETAITYIRFSEDRIINPVYVEDRLVPYFNANLLDFPGSHAGLLAHPDLAAKYLVAITRGSRKFPSLRAVKALDVETLSKVYFPDIAYDEEQPAEDSDEETPSGQVW